MIKVKKHQTSFYLLLPLALLHFLSCRSFGETNDFVMHKKKGKLIALVGISGSGKSTLTKELALLTRARIFLEPEEKDWPELITRSEIYGEFSAMSALRNIRVKNLYDALKLRNEGHIVIIDSYYDHITSYYLEKPGMEWLISPRDPYFEAAKLMVDTDAKFLPNVDCLVLLDIDIQTWKSFIKSRNRERDMVPGFQESVFSYRGYIEAAALKLAEERGVKLIRFEQVKANAKDQASLLKQVLINEKVLEL